MNESFHIKNSPHYSKIINLFGNSLDNTLLQSKSAFTLFKEELEDGCILAYNESLDQLLKNVIIPKRIIEFSGHFESTTPVCLRLCISVQLPKSLGGFGGEAFYISTNGNVLIEKLRELAVDFIEEYSREDEFNVEFILNHIYYTRVNCSEQLIACLLELELFLRQKNVRLLVIDSITYILRKLEVNERFRTINRIFQILRHLSDKFNLSVIITNFCTTRINGEEAYTVASFGDSFYHLVNSRIFFKRHLMMFHGKLTKNISNKEKEAVFKL